MRIVCYGKLRDMLGEESEVACEAEESVAGLRRRLANIHPHAAPDLLNPRTRACVDDMIVGEDFTVSGHDRVEFLPPLSGG